MQEKDEQKIIIEMYLEDALILREILDDAMHYYTKKARMAEVFIAEINSKMK